MFQDHIIKLVDNFLYWVRVQILQKLFFHSYQKQSWLPDRRNVLRNWRSIYCLTNVVKTVKGAQSTDCNHCTLSFLTAPTDCWRKLLTTENIVVSWFMVAVWNRADHIYFHAVVCSFFFFLFFIPRLISAAANWMSAILPHMVWP